MKHNAQIVTLMFARLHKYCEFYADMFDNTVRNDLKYNIALVQAFVDDNDVQALHKGIVMQETLVREHFYDVLKYIEDNNLITQHKVCK